MQRIIENFPEFKKGERNTTKHFNIMEELRKLVEARNLYDVSEIEQEIVSGTDGRTKHFKAIQALIDKEGMNKLEALRLVLLYALRYEDAERVRQLKTQLSTKLAIGQEQLAYIDCVLDYGGKAQRRGDLFGETGSMAAGAKRFLNSMFGEDVKNVLL